MKEREKFSSRLDLFSFSAGCAIESAMYGASPYITGQYGGAAFVP